MLRFVFESIGAHALLAASLLGLSSRAVDPTRFSAIAGVGAFYLYLDDLFDLHVRLAELLANDLGWSPPPGINHFDDLLVMLTALAGVAVVAWYRSELLKDAPFAAWFGASLGLFAFAIVVDARLDPSRTLSWWTEETTEFLGAACMAGAFYRRWKWLSLGHGVALAAPPAGEHLLASPLAGE